MSLHTRIYKLRARQEAARRLYRQGKPWSRNLAWKILDEIALETSGAKKEYSSAISKAVADGDMYNAFRLLGAAAETSIQNLEYARDEGYDRDFDDWLDK